MPIKKSIIYQSINQLLQQSLAFIIGILIVRMGSLDLMGNYAKYVSIMTIAIGIVSTGIQTNYLRSGLIRSFNNSIISLVIIYLVISLSLLPIYSQLFDQQYLSVLIFSISFLFMKYINIYIVKLRLLNKDIYSIIPKLIPYFTIILLVILVKPKTILQLSLILMVGWGLGIISTYKNITLIKRFKISFKEIKSIIKNSLIISGTTLATQIYANTDQIMIAEIMGNYESGKYKIAISFSVLAMPIIGVLSYIYLSEITRLIKTKNVTLLRRKFYKQLSINSAIGICFFMFCLIFLKYIIPFAYGNDAVDAVYLGIILSISVLINVIAMVITYTLYGINKDKIVLVSTSIGAIANIILNLMAIPRFGIIGAALASIITQALILIILTIFLYYRYNFSYITLQNSEKYKQPII